MIIMMAFGCALQVSANEPGAHVHGAATLEIAIDEAAVQLHLYSPLDNLLGFEHAPRNEKERQAVKMMASRFHQAESLFIFTPAAQCRLESVRLESTALAPELLMSGSGSGKNTDKSSGNGGRMHKTCPSTLTGSSASADTHAELEATWHFRCAVPQVLQGLDVRLFQMFPGLRRLDTAVAGPKGQSSTRLSPTSTRFKWR